MSVLPTEEADFSAHIPILIVGAGACGLVAALSAKEAGAKEVGAKEAGAEVLVLERDPIPAGSTALSAGMIPAPGTACQNAAGVEDTPELFARDLQGKSKGRSDPTILDAVVQAAGPAVDWLNTLPDVTLELVGGFLYPGHSALRMHAPADRSGQTLIGMLTRAAEGAGIDILTNATGQTLFSDGEGRVTGIRITRPDGGTEDLSCDRMILACNGFGGNSQMVATHIPEMARADYFGHTGNQGDAVTWGLALGGEAKHMGAYQGHGSVAIPHGILISWSLMMKGGIQVNRDGKRFANEHEGYSEKCVEVLAQPGGYVWNVYDQRLHRLGQEFEDYKNAMDQGAILEADNVADLAEAMKVPAEALAASIAQTAGQDVDTFGRDFSKTPGLEPPFHAVKVGGYLFHTQGGLRVDGDARVVREGTDEPLGNLYAGGGAACGVSGPAVDGYLSGNGLLTAVALGRLAGLHAARSLD